MPHYLVTIQMSYRQMFLVEAVNEETARTNYADGEQSDYWHGEPEIITVEEVPLEQATARLDLFGKTS